MQEATVHMLLFPLPFCEVSSICSCQELIVGLSRMVIFTAICCSCYQNQISLLLAIADVYFLFSIYFILQT